MIQQAQRLARLEDTFRVALMPDVHLGQLVPNGCVLATCERIYPEAIGRDIGCGLSAICFDIHTILRKYRDSGLWALLYPVAWVRDHS